MIDLAEVLSTIVLAAACLFAGYQRGRRVEQEWWTALLLDGATAVLLKATRSAGAPATQEETAAAPSVTS